MTFDHVFADLGGVPANRLTDPQGIAWEHFHTLGDIPVFSQRQGEPAAEASACCAR